MWIKICGNTRLEDCLHAAACGADAVGFIFAPGKRTVTTQHIASITNHLPATLEKVGVFTTSDPAIIAATVLHARLTGIQLHREYDPSLLQAVKQQLSHGGSTLQWIQVQTWDADQPASIQAAKFSAACGQIAADRLADRLLIDSATATASGGTGMRFDWAAASTALSNLDIPLVVAGGLRPETVADAIRALQPYGVDVSSGVELSPGVKDHTAVAAFIRNARGT